MAFLQDLRMTNIFPKRPDVDRPFGMPDIDSGNVAEMFRQVVPLADSLNRDRMQQQGALADIAARARQRPVATGVQLPGQGISQAPGRHSVFDPNANTRLGGDMGMTPSQNMFMRQDANQQAEEKATERENTRFGRAVDETKARERFDESMMDKRIQADTSRFNRDFEAKKQMADIGFGHQKDLTTQRGKQAMELANENAIQRRADILARERERGAQTRETNLAKPESSTQEKTDLNNKVQQMLLSNPQVAPFLTKNPDTGMFQLSEDATPEQAEWIRGRLGLGGSSTGKPTDKPKVMRQRNSKGQIRTSTDGGKTWTLENGPAKD